MFTNIEFLCNFLRIYFSSTSTIFSRSANLLNSEIILRTGMLNVNVLTSSLTDFSGYGFYDRISRSNTRSGKPSKASLREGNKFQRPFRRISPLPPRPPHTLFTTHQHTRYPFKVCPSPATPCYFSPHHTPLSPRHHPPGLVFSVDPPRYGQ